MGLQRWRSRYQRTNSGRDTDGHHQDVVDHECDASQQTRAGPDVLSRHRVRPAAAGIRADGLPIGKVDDGEKYYDGSADGDRVVNAGQAERDQQCECCFRTVGG